MLLQESNHLRDRCLITNYLRNTEHGSLQGCRATGHQCRRRLGKQLVGLVDHKTDSTVLQELLVVSGLDARSTSQYDIVISCQMTGSRYHRRQIIFYLLFPGPRKQSDDWSLCVPCTPGILHILPDFLCCWITDIMDGIMMFLLVEVHLERQDGEHLIHIPLDILDTVFLPCPYLWRDVIVNRYLRVRLDKFRYLQVKSRIVDQDDHIRLPLQDILLTHLHITKDGGKMEQDRDETHICQILVMLHTGTTHCRHHIASKEAELRMCILFLQRLHQMRRVQVTTRLSYYQIILHKSQFFICSIIS